MKEKILEILIKNNLPTRHNDTAFGRICAADEIMELINQEVERRIKERMPNKRDTEQARTNVLQQYLIGNISLYDVVCQTESFYYSRLTSSEKSNNSEGGGK